MLFIISITHKKNWLYLYGFYGEKIFVVDIFDISKKAHSENDVMKLNCQRS